MESILCNICGAAGRAFLQLDAVPPIQNRFFATNEEARRFPTTGVKYLWCDACQHISIIKNRRVQFDAEYNNDQTASRVAIAHYQNVAAEITNALSSREAKIVEIGCGRGELTTLLSRCGFSNAQGYDPSAPDDLDSLIQNTLWESSGRAEIDLLILRHTLEEIEGLDGFLRKISTSLVESGLVYCEITNASWLMRNQNIFSMYPEYSNLFTVSSLSRLFSRHELSIERVADYFDGEWLGIWGRKISSACAFNWQELLEKMAQSISTLPQPVVLWGAGGRGGNVLSFSRTDLDAIPFVVDINKAKQGLFIPPFGQEIVAPNALSEVAPRTILVSSRKYMDEVIAIAPANCIVISVDELCVTT